MDDNTVQFAARCKRQPGPGECNGQFKAGAVYAAESRDGSRQVVVLDDRHMSAVLEAETFDRFFVCQQVKLTLEMEKDDHNHWQEVMSLARKYGYITNAAGGTAILLCHSVQLEDCGFGEFIRIQEMNGIDRSGLPYPFNGQPEKDG